MVNGMRTTGLNKMLGSKFWDGYRIWWQTPEGLSIKHSEYNNQDEYTSLTSKITSLEV